MPSLPGANPFRPAVPGCQVAIPGRAPGTLGCLVRDVASADTIYLLSAAHVIANGTFDDPLGLPVLQPGTTPSQGVIGHVSRWGALAFSADTFPNLFDAAVARVAKVDVAPEIFSLGRPLGVREDVPTGTQVRKCGAMSGVTRSSVLRADYPCAFFYRDNQGQAHRAGFQQQILCRATGDDGFPFTLPGDSGAAVVDGQNRVVGLVVGRTDEGTVVCPIGPVLQALRVAIA